MWATPSNNFWDPKIRDKKIRGRYFLGLRSSGANFSNMSDSEEQDCNSSDDEDLMNVLFLIMLSAPSCLLRMRKCETGKGGFTCN
jgi:hypothetical protein